MAIEDETELEPWLKDQPTDLSASVALRAAFRVLPFIFDEWSLDKKRNTLSLWTLRATITAACSVQADDDKLRSVASTVAKRLTFIADGFPDSAFQWIAAADTAIDATEASLTKDSETASKHAYAANHDSGRAGVFAADHSLRQTIKHMMFRDCDEGKTSTQLLNDALAPVDTSEPQIEKSEKALLAYRSSLAFLRSLDPPWSFWSRWYERAMAGDPLPWDLQREVALIPDVIWEQGPVEVAKEIKRIEDYFYTKHPREHPETVPQVERKQLIEQVSRLLENPVMSGAIAESAGCEVQRAIEDYIAATGANSLPDELRHLERLPAQFAQIAALFRSEKSQEEKQDALVEEIKVLNATIAALEDDLAEARSKMLTGVIKTNAAQSFGKMFGTGIWIAPLGLAACHFFGVMPQDITLDNLRHWISEQQGTVSLKVPPLQ